MARSPGSPDRQLGSVLVRESGIIQQLLEESS